MNNTLNFCTVFYSNYLPYGLLLHDSLKKTCPKFHLFIFALDKKCYHDLKSLNLSSTTIISPEEFENDKLLEVREKRTKAEYCWTVTPFTIEYIFRNYKLDLCTYLDADLFFFSSPDPLIEYIKNKSVLIIEHRYTSKYDRSDICGKYNVQFITFRNSMVGRQVLNWWSNKCLDWCYFRSEKGKYGDQKYLDDWPRRFKEIGVIDDLGFGVGPWNMQQYYFFRKNNKIYGIERSTGKEFLITFFHFHTIKFSDSVLDKKQFYSYELTFDAYKLIYKPYLKKFMSIIKKIKEINYPLNFKINFAQSIQINILDYFYFKLKDFKRDLIGHFRLI